MLLTAILKEFRDEVGIACRRLGKNLCDAARNALWRQLRGYAPDDLYSLDMTIARTAAPLFRAFARVTPAYPEELTEEEWRAILVEIAEGFEARLGQFGGKANYEKIEKGMALFAEWSGYFWY